MITIIGTAHISKDSVAEVKEKILELKPSVVAVELCKSRYSGLTAHNSGASAWVSRSSARKDGGYASFLTESCSRNSGASAQISKLIKSENSFILIVNILLSFLQRRLGEWVGAPPGGEMLAAIETAKELNIGVAMIDRDIEITISRAAAKMSAAEKIFLVKEMLTTFSTSKDELEKEIAGAKSADYIDEILEKFKKVSPNAFEVLVSERDIYMARNLVELEKKFGNVVAVVGAGHKRGIEKEIAHASMQPMEELDEVPEKRFSVAKVVKFGFPAFILLMFTVAFYKGISLKTPLILWAINHAVPTFIGVLIAGGSILSAVVGMLVSPVTSLNPVLAAGWFAGTAEARVRKATPDGISNKNAFRILLVTALANLGSTIGTFISLPTIVLPLLKSIFG